MLQQHRSQFHVGTDLSILTAYVELKCRCCISKVTLIS